MTNAHAEDSRNGSEKKMRQSTLTKIHQSDAPAIMYAEMLNRGSGDYLVVISTFIEAKQLIKMFREFFENKLGIGRWYERDNRIIIKANDMECNLYFIYSKSPEAVESMRVLTVHIDESIEPVSEEVFDAIYRRSVQHRGRMFITEVIKRTIDSAETK